MTIGGLEMLVAQAERQFEIWTGHTAARRTVPSGGRCGDRDDDSRATRRCRLDETDDASKSSWSWRGAARSCRWCKEIIADLLTPVSAFLKIAEHSDYAFLFESVEGGEHVARYSFLGKDPFLVLRARGGRTIDRARRRHDRNATSRSSRRCAG